MPDPTSRVLVPAIADVLGDLRRLAEILDAIDRSNDQPDEVQRLVLDGLTLVEHSILRLNLEPAGPIKN